MKYLIGNAVINSEHIVMAEYFPEETGDCDDETGQPYIRESQCRITLDSVHVEQYTNYNGDPTGTAPQSDVVKWHGSVADAFWDVYSKDAYAVVV